MKLLPRQRRLRVAIKRFLYSQLYLRDFFLLMFGRSKPLVQFKVEATPPSVYFNFELDPERVPGLQQEFDIPYPLAPIRCVAGEEPFYCLTLNIYRVSGWARGIRAEWSMYIEDPEGNTVSPLPKGPSSIHHPQSAHAPITATLARNTIGALRFRGATGATNT